MKLLKKIKKDNILFFIIGAILFGGISTVVATTILSSTVSYTNNNQTTVEGALDDLYGMINIVCYNGTCGKLSFKYWNDSFSTTPYQSNSLPTNNYTKKSLLEQNYGSSNFASRPYYIRSVLINGVTVGHQVCLWNTTTSKELCFSNNYWAGTINTTDANAGEQTKIKLQRDIQIALGVTIQDSSCNYDANLANCYIGSINIYTRYDGYVGISSGSTSCGVNFGGYAGCFE